MQTQTHLIISTTKFTKFHFQTFIFRNSVFRQIKSNNEWEDAEVNSETAKLIENSILTKARELRLGSKAFE